MIGFFLSSEFFQIVGWSNSIIPWIFLLLLLVQTLVSYSPEGALVPSSPLDLYLEHGGVGLLPWHICFSLRLPEQSLPISRKSPTSQCLQLLALGSLPSDLCHQHLLASLLPFACPSGLPDLCSCSLSLGTSFFASLALFLLPYSILIGRASPFSLCLLLRKCSNISH